VTARAPDMASKRFLALLVLAAILGVVASLAAWCFLELVHQINVGAYEKLPDLLGFDSTPLWWSIPLLAIAGLIVAFAIHRMPGRGGHVPAFGLSTGQILPEQLPGVMLAGLATIGLGAVLGPEAPLIALGGGLGLLAARLVGKDATPEVGQILAASATFAALSLIFGSPLIAAIILIEVTGLGGPRLTLILIPGLLAAGIGSLVSIGMGSFTGLSSSAYALDPFTLPAFDTPDIVDFLWTIPLAAAIALGTVVIFSAAKPLVPLMERRGFVALPVAGIVIGILALVFAEITDKLPDEVLFSGQDQVSGLITSAGTWSLGALALLVVLKGIGYAISLAGFRGGPTFPALFLGVAAGLMAAQLPGFETTPAVAVGLGAAVVAVLRIPLSAVVLAALLTSTTGLGASPLIIVGVVVAYIVTEAVSPRAPAPSPAPTPAREPARAPAT
jgi:H+/Cl- antiporter ClcA